MRLAPRHLLRVSALAIALGASVCGPPVRASLKTKRARKAILDLRKQLQAADEAAKARHEALNTQLQDQVGTLRRSPLDLNSQIEALRGEIAKLRGQNEQLARDLARDAAPPGRPGPDPGLAPQAAGAAEGQPSMATSSRPTPKSAASTKPPSAWYAEGEFADAVSALQSFQSASPPAAIPTRSASGSAVPSTASATTKDAIATFKAFIAGNPEHPRAEALLALANCQIELKDNKTARRSLEDLIKAYPGTEAAKAAKNASSVSSEPGRRDDADLERRFGGLRRLYGP